MVHSLPPEKNKPQQSRQRFENSEDKHHLIKSINLRVDLGVLCKDVAIAQDRMLLR
jgi:hypothetical protein